MIHETLLAGGMLKSIMRAYTALGVGTGRFLVFVVLFSGFVCCPAVSKYRPCGYC